MYPFVRGYICSFSYGYKVLFTAPLPLFVEDFLVLSLQLWTFVFHLVPCNRAHEQDIHRLYSHVADRGLSDKDQHKGLTNLTHAFHPRVIITTPLLRTKSHFWIQLFSIVLDVGTRHFKPTETFQIYTFYVLPPVRGQEGLYKRRSPPITQNKFFKRKLSKPTRRIPKAP